jgi:DNA-binding transcriptional ArsR family regulator
MLRDKGKYASATENRRFVWHEIVWPLILEVNDVSFTLKQYQKKRDEVCKNKDVEISTTSRGLVSLLQKGIIIKENELYSIHYRLIAYMRLKADCDYATAIHEVSMSS